MEYEFIRREKRVIEAVSVHLVKFIIIIIIIINIGVFE